MQVVLDASALLAYLRQEPGSAGVDDVLASAVITSVNWAEVAQKSLSAGVAAEGLREDLEALGLMVATFSAEDADTTADLWQQTRRRGLSLADRACLSLALRLNLPVLTCDRAWAELGLPLQVELLR